MGQYYKIVNLDKKEYLHPHTFGDGLKLLEFGDGGLTMTALAVLLSNGNGRGGGDLNTKSVIPGRWAGDRIVVAGDYGDEGKWLENFSQAELEVVAKKILGDYQKIKNVNLYDYAEVYFENISPKVLKVLCEDKFIAERVKKDPFLINENV